MSAFDLIDPDSFSAEIDPVDAPISGFADTFGAKLDDLMFNNMMFGPEKLRSEEREKQRNVYRTIRNSDLSEDAAQAVLSPEQLLDLPRHPKTGKPIFDDAFIGTIDAYVDQLRTSDPERYKNLRNSSEIESDMAERGAEMAEKAALAAEGATGFVNITSTIAAGILAAATDPADILSFGFGAPISSRIITTMLIEGSINAAVEVVSHPTVSKWQKTIGNDEYGLDDLAQNALFGFLFGAGVSGTMKGLGKVAASLAGSKHYALTRAQITAKSIGEDELSTAFGIQARKADIDAHNPGVSKAKHREVLDGLSDDLSQGKPIDVERFGLDPDDLKKADLPLEHAEFRDAIFDGTFVEKFIRGAKDADFPLKRIDFREAISDKTFVKEFGKDANDIDAYVKPVDRVVGEEVENLETIRKAYESPERVLREEQEFNQIVENRKLKDDDVVFRDVDDNGQITEVRLKEHQELKAELKAVKQGFSICSTGGNDGE